jgi:hypothetical protein
LQGNGTTFQKWEEEMEEKINKTDKFGRDTLKIS